MKNINISVPFVDGSLRDIVIGDYSGKEFIHNFIGDDFGAPPKGLDIEATTASGKKVRVYIPYDATANALVFIDGKILD